MDTILSKKTAGNFLAIIAVLVITAPVIGGNPVTAYAQEDKRIYQEPRFKKHEEQNSEKNNYEYNQGNQRKSETIRKQRSKAELQDFYSQYYYGFD